MSKIRRIVLTHLRQPLIQPYRLSYRTFEEFEPFLVEVEDTDGRRGFSDGHVSPGSSSETREGAWGMLTGLLPKLLGKDPDVAKTLALQHFAESKVAVTAVATAIEVLERHPATMLTQEVVLPLLTPINAMEPGAIEREVEEWLAQGFATFKIKVGKNVDADLARVASIQRAVKGRATLRLDANRAYSREDGMRFARSLSPEGIELFEQPCEAEDWDANAEVARVSSVPLMLDEPISTLRDIDRAGTIEGIGYCKLKLKRFGTLTRLIEGLIRVRTRGMRPVLGDGLGSEAHNWLEACAAVGHIDNAGEFNGFLKPRGRLLSPPMPFEAGAIRLPAGYRPELDRAAIERATVKAVLFQ
jgi:L-alanine-DL-glutamate epimerase-like enolase superfamily enzyme